MWKHVYGDAVLKERLELYNQRSISQIGQDKLQGKSEDINDNPISQYSNQDLTENEEDFIQWLSRLLLENQQ